MSITVNWERYGIAPSSPAETGRANRKTVLALKARAALYAASPLFNPTDNKETCGIVQLKPIRKFLDDSNGFAEKAKLLVEDYSSLWSKDNYNDATSELIFLRRATTTH